MFSINIIIFSSIVFFIKESSAVNSNEVNSTVDITSSDNVKEKFYKYVDNKDGLISTTGVQELLFKELNVFVTIDQAKKFVALFDRDGHHKIGLKDIKKIELMLAILLKKETLNIEDNHDDDGDSTISANDIDLFLLNDFDGDIRLKKAKEILLISDQDENGPIEFEKMEELGKITTSSLQKKTSSNTWEEIFRNYDKNNDGNISAEDFQKFALQNQKINLSLEEIKKITDVFDENDDGQINLNEFQKIVKLMMVSFKRDPETVKYLIAKNIFQNYDENGDGFITVNEFRKLLAKEFYLILRTQEAEEIIKNYDTNNDGKIDIEEFENMDIMQSKVQYETLDDYSEEDWIHKFKRYDVNDSGKISTSTFQTLLQKEFFKVIDIDHAKALLEVFDIDGNHEIEFEEFKKMGPILTKSLKIELQPYQDAFNHFDIDRNQYVTAEELKQSLKTLNIDKTMDEVKQTIMQFDTDGDAEINLQEFIEMIKMMD
ncbi:uncharacterized protein LOC126844975 isoform X1 [Adelges cooleyi]|uniref:uncharacterized protein LOC126844975 isoform X1 n=2 Tax=Adelges cooleyi TaxID=133065 RepID=UPI00217F3BC7|nr:uncharacterized protein LOC126844975 isoform X1 [Adelges cooleyi]